MSAGALGGYIGPGNRLADHGEACRVAKRSFGIDFDGGATISDERGNLDACSAGDETHFAICQREFRSRPSKLLGSEIEKSLAGTRRSLTDLGASASCSGAAA